MKKKLVAFSIMAMALMLAFIPAVLAEGAWSDNFDSYPTGQDLHGVGGWKGWFNDPAFTAFTTDVQAQSTPNSVDIVADADLVHEYSENAGFWVYRASQYIPANMSGTSYYIMLNQYDDLGATNNWSVQVNFNSASGLMVDDGQGGAQQPYIADQWVDICLEIDLGQDTQAFYYNGAVFYTGTWSGHVSGGGITAIGAVDLFANGASSVYYDDMSLEPGGPGDCLPPQPSILMTKTVGTEDGVCATTDEIAVTTGTDVYYCYEVMNTGEITLSLHDLDDDQLGLILDDFAYDLGPGMSVDTVAAGLVLSATIMTDTTNTAVWTAFNVDGPTASYTDTATVNVVSPSIEMTKTVKRGLTGCGTESSIDVAFGADVTYCYTVMNTGDYTLTLHDLEDDQLVDPILSGFPYALAPGASVAVTQTVFNITQTVVNTATWTAYDDTGISVSYTDSAEVIARAPTDVSLSSFGSEAAAVTWPAIALVLAVVFVGAALIWRRQTNA